MTFESCPVCGNKIFSHLFCCIDYTVSHETFSVVQCSNCHLGITQPIPDTEKLSGYYISEEYISHSGKHSGIKGKLYLFARSFSLKWKRRIIERYIYSGSILDYGCGTGEFLNYMQKHRWTITGIEPSGAARNRASMLTGKNIFPSIETISQQTYDCITLWHVLEHITDLNEVLEKIKNLLSDKGHLLIAVPNYKSWDAEHYKSHWAGFDVPRHIWHFTRKNMKLLLDNHGLRLKETIPMKLDAYYVSMLSEQYKKSGQFKQLVKALYHGFKSNRQAAKNGEYSSIIYVVSR